MADEAFIVYNDDWNWVLMIMVKAFKYEGKHMEVNT